MPVTKQATKKVRQDKRKAASNLKVRDAFKSAARAFRKNPTAEGLAVVYKSVDRAAKTNVIHKNRAARIKSRLSKLLATGKSAAVTPKKSVPKVAEAK